MLLWVTVMVVLVTIFTVGYVACRAAYFFVPAIWWNLRDLVAEEWFDVKDELRELLIIVRDSWKEYFA